MNVVSALRRSFRRSSLRRNKSAENVSGSKEDDGNYDDIGWRHLLNIGLRCSGKLCQSIDMSKRSKVRLRDPAL